MYFVAALYVVCSCRETYKLKYAFSDKMPVNCGYCGKSASNGTTSIDRLEKKLEALNASSPATPAKKTRHQAPSSSGRISYTKNPL